MNDTNLQKTAMLFDFYYATTNMQEQTQEQTQLLYAVTPCVTRYL